MKTKNATKGKEITTNEEELFQSLVENSMVGIYIIQDDKLRYVNPRFAEIFGYSQEELIDSYPELIVAEEDRKMVMENIRARIQGKKQSIHYLVKGQRKNGELIFIEVFGSLTQYQGRPAIIGSLIDTTEREIAKEQIVKEKSLSDTIINSLPTSFSLFDRTGKYIRWNKRLQTISGYTKNELGTMKVMDLIAENDKELVQKTIEKVLTKGWAEMEVSGRKKSGKIVPYYLNLQLVEYEGQPCVISQGFDITLRKRMEEKLKKSAANLHAIFDTTDTAYILVDRDLRIISINHEASDILKHELGIKTKVGDSLSSYHFADLGFATGNLRSEVLRGEHMHFEINYQQPGGYLHWYFVRIFPIKDQQKEIFGMMLAISDITARKNAEMQQEKTTSDLEQRTKDLEQFAYIVSHNLRAPVASMLGISEVLHSNQITREEYTQLEEFLFSSVHQLNEIIKDLNYILQIKRSISEKKEVVHFSQLVEDITLSIQNMIQKEDVQIITDFSAVDEFRTIKSYLYSIFYNLISNSIKYKQPGKKQIVEIKSTKNNDSLMLIFKDVGLGMDLSKKGEQVFGLYSRFHPEIEGKGLGLYMVKTQVEMLGGNIQVKSQLNVGTEFIIEFKDENA